jgi:hypothetical protein
VFRLNRAGITDHYPCLALALLAWMEGDERGDVEEEIGGTWVTYNPRYLRCLTILTPPQERLAA